MSEAEKLGEAVSTEGCRPETAPVEPTSAGPAWTAGPWRADCNATGLRWFVTHAYALGRADICETRNSNREANARLISAAPDLYEAGLELADAAVDYARLVQVEGYPKNDIAVHAAYERLRLADTRQRAALAKARGQ